jgi:hypothetical protein
MEYEQLGASALGDRRVFEELELGIEYVLGSRVRGDVAEFGTHGRTARVICRKLAVFQSNLPVHFFDSFEGFPRATMAGDIDAPHVVSNIWPEHGSAPPVSPQQLRTMLEEFLPPGQIKIYAGWFADTLPTIRKGTMFSMINMDCDLYQSTIEVLRFLFGHRMISDGCLILFDDWSCNNASPKYGERKAWSEIIAEFRVNYSDAGAYGWCGHKFHVHDYVSLAPAG